MRIAPTTDSKITTDDGGGLLTDIEWTVADHPTRTDYVVLTRTTLLYRRSVRTGRKIDRIEGRETKVEIHRAEAPALRAVLTP